MRDEEDRLKQVARGARHETARREILETPVGRRAALVLGLRSAVSLWIMLGSGAALSLFGSLAGREVCRPARRTTPRRNCPSCRAFASECPQADNIRRLPSGLQAG